MKVTYFRILFISAITATIISCSKNSKNNSQPCNVSYTESSPLSQDGPVQYLAGVTGSATIGSISYLDSAGTTTVNNPSLPWTKYVNLKMGALAKINAHGNANPGAEIIISIFADNVQSGAGCP